MPLSRQQGNFISGLSVENTDLILISAPFQLVNNTNSIPTNPTCILQMQCTILFPHIIIFQLGKRAAIKPHFLSLDLKPPLVLLCFPRSTEDHYAAGVGEKHTASTRRALRVFVQMLSQPSPQEASPLLSLCLSFMQSLPLHKAFLDSKSLPAGRGIVSDHCPQICRAKAASLLCQ